MEMASLVNRFPVLEHAVMKALDINLREWLNVVGS